MLCWRGGKKKETACVSVRMVSKCLCNSMSVRICMQHSVSLNPLGIHPFWNISIIASIPGTLHSQIFEKFGLLPLETFHLYQFWNLNNLVFVLLRHISQLQHVKTLKIQLFFSFSDLKIKRLLLPC